MSYRHKLVKRIPIKLSQRQARVLWCRKHVTWLNEYWARVMLSAESLYSLAPHSIRLFIWCERGSRYHQEIIVEKDKTLGRIIALAGIMINGCRDLQLMA